MRVKIFGGIETCPPCRSCGGSGDSLPIDGRVAVRHGCPACDGTGRDVPQLFRDAHGIAWVRDEGPKD